jgi:hypothetical protein
MWYRQVYVLKLTQLQTNRKKGLIIFRCTMTHVWRDVYLKGDMTRKPKTNSTQINLVL